MWRKLLYLNTIILAVVAHCQNALLAQTNAQQHERIVFSVGADSCFYYVAQGKGESIAESRHCALQNYVSMIESAFSERVTIKSIVFSEGASTADIGEVYIEMEIPNTTSINLVAVIVDEKWGSIPHRVSDEEIGIEIHIDVLLKVRSSNTRPNQNVLYE